MGLVLALIGIFFGFQACLFFHLWMSGEIVNIRFGFLVFTLLGALVFVVRHLNSSISLLVAILPIIFWAIFWLKDKVVERQIDKNFYEREIEKWERTIEFDPKNVGAYIALGDIYEKEGRLDKAISYYDDALNLYKSPSVESKLKRARAEKEAEESRTIFCSECGATNPKGRKFCVKCNSSLSGFVGLEKGEVGQIIRSSLWRVISIVLLICLVAFLIYSLPLYLSIILALFILCLGLRFLAKF